MMLTLTLPHSLAALIGALLLAPAAPALAAPAPAGDQLLAELGGRSFYRRAGAVRAAGDACVSCSSCASGSDSCAVNTPGGLLELTTFWDTDPATGPADVFTIHGLWPGTFACPARPAPTRMHTLPCACKRAADC